MSTETAISHTPVPKPAAEDGSISWTAKTSANGVAYEVSVRNAAPSEAATVGDESYDVDWPVTGDNWVETEGDIHSRITHYKLMDATPSRDAMGTVSVEAEHDGRRKDSETKQRSANGDTDHYIVNIAADTLAQNSPAATLHLSVRHFTFYNDIRELTKAVLVEWRTR
ncbi:hypothetical protein BKA62DRAFT_671604 [Auriculariales sp. MPI-PUGE-AT-0066]|nr:hypothetical protein BKA62DRAFT_671604 [Auriculariales sp. MPI-PUGE-AT-0066]